MSTENHSEQDEVIALMAQEGISRVKATKLLYELAKQRKKDAAKIELNINQVDILFPRTRTALNTHLTS